MREADTPADKPIADAAARTWVDAAPRVLRPYLRLSRYDRPIGFWLLAIPCWQGLLLARIGEGLSWSDLHLAVLFGIGAVTMRGAGCTYNDMIDRDLDAQVARTANRPLAAGTISLRAAAIWLGAQCLVGLIVLVQLPPLAIAVALGSLVLVAAYPFMKRITYWPQAWLGLTFNWGVPTAYVAAADAIEAPMVLLYASAVVWTIGYDTIYACQDKEDDALIGVKSSALALGAGLKPALWVFYGLAAGLAAAAAVIAEAPLIFAAGFAPYAAHLFHQIRRTDPANGALCLKVFKSNRTTGLLLAGALFLAALDPLAAS